MSTPPFELVSPPDGLSAIVDKTLEAIDFPWERLQPYFQKKSIDYIKIKTPMLDGVSNTITGLWNAADNTIYLGTQFTNWMDDIPFVLTHEIGHLIDRAVLVNHQRDELVKLFHSEPALFDTQSLYNHDSEEMTHLETWWNGGAHNYEARIYECFADEFVATFAPHIWDGSATGTSAHYPRFVHWTDDHDKVREIVLWQPSSESAPKPTPEEPVKHTRGKQIDGALRELDIWLKHHPKRPRFARARVLIARKALRSIRPRRV